MTIISTAIAFFIGLFIGIIAGWMAAQADKNEASIANEYSEGAKPNTAAWRAKQ